MPKLTKERIDKYYADLMEFDSVECEEVLPLIAHIREQEAELAKLRAALRKVMQLCSLVDNEPRIVGQIDAVAVLALHPAPKETP